MTLSAGVLVLLAVVRVRDKVRRSTSGGLKGLVTMVL